MFLFQYHQVKSLDAQRRARSLARYQATRDVESPQPRLPVAEVIEITFPEECQHDERLGA
ncbi:MAG: hypothetical protein WCE80_03405 [Acidimicrobiia bacterium]